MRLDGLELKLPPLLVLALAAGLMGLLRALTPMLNLDLALPVRLLVGLPLLAAGFGVALLGVREFRRWRTTLSPLNPERASTLVRSGVYRHTRNPMYLGMLFALAACAVLLANPAALLILPAFIVYLNRFQIQPEERQLARQFGADFEQLKREVRRWL